jgi:hypothetical protein
MAKDFQVMMSKRSKDQLLGVLREHYDYVPEAVAAANAELKRRGVNAFDIAAAADLGEENSPKADLMAAEPLQWQQALVWLLFPFLALTPIGTKRFKAYADQGFRCKSVQMLEVCVIGFSIYALVAIISLNVFH